MPNLQLLPNDFDDLLREAVCAFWNTRGAPPGSQGGNRGAVTNGKTMDGFIKLVKAVSFHCGLPASSVFTDSRSTLTLPGYYRPTKNWDALVIHKHRLVAAFEFKSQVGPSFGNNLNNRTEEAIGNAADLWEAHTEGAYEPTNHKGHGLIHVDHGPSEDPRPPFLGWLMLLEDCAGSMTPVAENSKHYRVFPEFRSATYADRYRILCERLMLKGLYSSACLILSTREQGAIDGSNRSATAATSVKALFTEYAGRAAAAAQGI